MLLIGGNGITFKCGDLTCILNTSFGIILYTNHCALYDQNSHSVGFVISVKYLSFIKTINRKFTFETNLDEIFQFKNLSDKNKLEEYVLTQKHDFSYEIVPDLVNKLKIKENKRQRTFKQTKFN